MKKFEKLTTKKFQTLENKQMDSIRGGLPSLPRGYTYRLSMKLNDEGVWEHSWIQVRDTVSHG